MAKKKQFAGKKTKLAKLPLTQALASQAASEAEAPSATSQLSFIPPSPLTWDEVRAGRGGPLAITFLSLVQDLAALKLAMQDPPAALTADLTAFLPEGVPPLPRILQALRQARQSLRDLHHLLVRP